MTENYHSFPLCLAPDDTVPGLDRRTGLEHGKPPVLAEHVLGGGGGKFTRDQHCSGPYNIGIR